MRIKFNFWFQVFSRFRHDDRLCADEEDAAPESLKSQEFRENWECLSAESTEKLLSAINPRAVFDGHTHFGCKTWSTFISLELQTLRRAEKTSGEAVVVETNYRIKKKI